MALAVCQSLAVQGFGAQGRRKDFCRRHAEGKGALRENSVIAFEESKHHGLRAIMCLQNSLTSYTGRHLAPFTVVLAAISIRQLPSPVVYPFEPLPFILVAAVHGQ